MTQHEDSNWLITEMVCDLDFGRLIDPNLALKTTGKYFEEDAFDVETSLYPEVMEWIENHVQGRWSGAGFLQANILTMWFEKSEDSTLFKLMWR